jgi:hypothetical protein
MGQMKQLAIELHNQDISLIENHYNYINQLHESGLPIWMAQEYANYNHLLEMQEEIESRPTGIILMDELSSALNEPIIHMMNYVQFKHSDEGENYHAFFGNWGDAYQSYRKDKLNPL